MFLASVGFWNFLGAGVFGFLINLPIVSYYEIGTALTANHAHAAMMGRDFVTPDDVKIFVREALCHRIIMKMEYEIDNRITPQSVVDAIVARTPVPKDFGRK